MLDGNLRVELPDGTHRPLAEFFWPTLCLMLAAFCLALSMFTAYWSLTMYAPQYPKGLTVSVYLNHLDGDVSEVDELNHYLGLKPLNDGGQLERQISLVTVSAMAMLLVAGIFIHNRWAGVLALPAIAFPAVFLGDLSYILYQYGHSVDPTSALGSSIKPFTPPLLGTGAVGQFRTVAQFQPGLWLTLTATVLLVVGLYYHRRIYKAVGNARKAADSRA